MLPSADRRAICDVTFLDPRAEGGLHREFRRQAGVPLRDSPPLPAGLAGGERPNLEWFCRVTGYHRKYAIRRLNGPPPEPGGRVRRHRPCTHGLAVIDALRTIWAAAGYPWSVRLKALLPLWLPWARRRLHLSGTKPRRSFAVKPRH